ncbi:TPA: hypothetical protein ACGB9W_004753 [Pseudomonas aeruginosa]
MSTIDCNTSSHPTGATPATFDESAWRAVCEMAASEAVRGCGQSFDWYVERLSSAIDEQVVQLPEGQRAQALQIAQELGYATPAERQETRDLNAADGCCKHGIPLDCCPAGCGEF